jgi:hypothetical protein
VLHFHSPVVSNLIMNRMRQYVVFSKPVLFLVGVVAVSAGLFVSIKRHRTRPPIVDGVPAEIVVVHVERSLTKVHASSVAAMKDWKYFATDEEVGLFGFKSACRQRMGTLPPKWSPDRLRAVVEMPEFQNISSAKQSKEAVTWYVRARVGQAYKCFGISDREAANLPAAQPLLSWTADVSTNHPNEISSYECAAFTAESLPSFCDARP